MSDLKTPAKGTYRLANGSNIEITGLPMKITNESLKNPNVIKSIQNLEQKTGRKIIGVHVIYG